MAERVRELFRNDSILTHEFHHQLAGGKWNHIMAQTHIGYTYWQQPEFNIIPEVIEISVPDEPILGVSLEGSEHVWPGSEQVPLLPRFEQMNQQSYFMDLFNRGTIPFECTIQPSESWMIPEKRAVSIDKEERIHMTVDWEKVPEGLHRVPVQITGTGDQSVTIFAEIDNRNLSTQDLPPGTFVENNGLISMEAVHFHGAVEQENVHWTVIPNLGKTLSSVISTPVTAPGSFLSADSPHLEYNLFLRDTGVVTIHAYLSPTLHYHNAEGLKFAVSMDDSSPQIINMHDPDTPYLWNQWVSNNIIIKSSAHHISQPGFHQLKWWRIDAGVVLQKIVIQIKEGPIPRYLGPPESKRINP